MRNWLSRVSSWPNLFNLAQGRQNSLFHHSIYSCEPFVSFKSSSDLSRLSAMSQSHPQNQNSTSKPDNTDASKVNSDHDETQASKENTPALNNKERVPSPTPQSAQASHLPSSQSLPTTKSTNLSGQSSPEHCSSSVPAPNHDANEAPRLLDKASDMPNDRNSQGDRYQSPPPPQEPEPDLGSSKEPLEAYHWDELEQRFYTEMTGCEEVEKGIQSDFDKLLEVSSLLCCLLPRLS